MNGWHGTLSTDSGGPGGVFAESGRVEAFSDGVFAVAITLLVLGLKAPVHRGTMARDLLAQWPAYVAYLASFAYVGVIWVNHHQLFTRIARVNAGLLWCNLALLLTTSVLPFPTAVVGSAFQVGGSGDQKAALVFYAATGATTAASWLLLFHFLSHTPGLLHDEGQAAFFAQERHRAGAGLLLYAASGLVALWLPVAGLAIACTLPVFYAITNAGLRPPGTGLGRMTNTRDQR
jgi:uncharacterized membrane protein